MIVLGPKAAPPGSDHSGGRRRVQIIFTKKNMRFAVAPLASIKLSTRERFDEIPEALALVGFFADVAEHGEEIVGPQVARRARHLAFGGLQRLERGGPLREELEGGRE